MMEYILEYWEYGSIAIYMAIEYKMGKSEREESSVVELVINIAKKLWAKKNADSNKKD